MGKTLLLMRHGKSDWDVEIEDHQRPLKKRGEKAARRMGPFVTTAFGPPELVVTSNAVRARRTVELAAESAGWDAPVRSTADLYDVAVADVMEVIGAVDDQVDRLLLCGHEPTWSELVAHLAGGGRFKLPTAAVACIGFDVGSWKDVAAGGGELLALVGPKHLGG